MCNVQCSNVFVECKISTWQTCEIFMMITKDGLELHMRHLIKSEYFALNTACKSTVRNMEIMRIFEVLFEKFNVNRLSA